MFTPENEKQSNKQNEERKEEKLFSDEEFKDPTSFRVVS